MHAPLGALYWKQAPHLLLPETHLQPHQSHSSTWIYRRANENVFRKQNVLPLASPPEWRIIIQTRHESCLSWYVSAQVLSIQHRKNSQGLKYKIAFSASCLLLSCCCLSFLFSFASVLSPMAKWNPAHQQAQALSVDSHPPSSALCCVDRGDLF